MFRKTVWYLSRSSCTPDRSSPKTHLLYWAPDFHRWDIGYLWIPSPRARRRNWFGTSDFQIDPIQQIHFQTDFCFESCYFGFCVQLQPDYSHYLDWFPLDLQNFPSRHKPVQSGGSDRKNQSYRLPSEFRLLGILTLSKIGFHLF